MTYEPYFEKVVQGYRLILEGLGLDLEDPHLRDTPTRAAKALYREMCAGLTSPEPPKMTTFPADGAKNMVISRGIPVRSLCAHHFLPFVGTAVIGYVPNELLLGLSKLSRAVEFKARKPQVQETLTAEIADFLTETLFPGGNTVDGGVAVLLRARHFCMEVRGVNHVSDVTTSALRGCFNAPEVRAEFLKLAEG